MRIDRVKLTTALASKGLKVYELAEISGLSRGTITAVKNGKSCSTETAEKLAKGLGTNVEWLLEPST